MKYSIKDIGRGEEGASRARRICPICFLRACTDDIFRRDLQRYIADDSGILSETVKLLPSSTIFRGTDAPREDALCNTFLKRRELRVGPLAEILSKGTLRLWFWKRFERARPPNRTSQLGWEDAIQKLLCNAISPRRAGKAFDARGARLSGKLDRDAAAKCVRVLSNWRAVY